MTAVDHITTQLARALAAKQDEEIVNAITSHIGQGNWNFSDLQPRIRIQILQGSPVKTIMLDDKPILRVYPAEPRFENDGPTIIMTASFKFEHIDP